MHKNGIRNSQSLLLWALADYIQCVEERQHTKPSFDAWWMKVGM